MIARPPSKLPNVAALERELRAAGDPAKAASTARFFKTGKGEYAEGDRFLGIAVPVQRAFVRRYAHLPLADIDRLLTSPLHEFRGTALEILKAKYRAADVGERVKIYDFYLAHTDRINNWDLVDCAARAIVGEHLVTRPRRILDRLARSNVMWERRIAIVATHAFIKCGELEDTFRISDRLLGDSRDLMHKAVGWMLREAGIVDRARMLSFLEQHYDRVPRTALRYAIEHLPPARRKQILAGRF